MVAKSALGEFFPRGPLSARNRFKMRPLTNCFFVAAIFIPASIICFLLPLWFIWEIALIGILYFLFFQVWHERTIWLNCPICHKLIATNTPWVCGHCGGQNKSTDRFPFVNRCEKCNAEPKAYKCHHRGCGQLIFLSKDRQSENYAVCLNAETAVGPEDEPKVQENAKRRREHLIVIEALDQKYDALRRASTTPKSPLEAKRESVRRHSESFMAMRQAAQEQKAENAKTFVNNETNLKLADLAVDDWLRRQLDGEE